jgi:hypothetical protein
MQIRTSAAHRLPPTVQLALVRIEPIPLGRKVFFDLTCGCNAAGLIFLTVGLVAGGSFRDCFPDWH